MATPASNALKINYATQFMREQSRCAIEEK